MYIGRRPRVIAAMDRHGRLKVFANF